MSIGVNPCMIPVAYEDNFRKELESLLNKYNKESFSNTPDFILAHFIRQSLDAFNLAVNDRDRWYGISPSPGWKRK